MERYIAFLRGVNISGKNRVPMAEHFNPAQYFKYVRPITRI